MSALSCNPADVEDVRTPDKSVFAAPPPLLTLLRGRYYHALAFPGRLMAGQQILVLLIEVRILARERF